MPKLPSEEADELIEAARTLRRVREAGQAPTPDQLELEEWVREFRPRMLPRCNCGRQGHNSHRSAAQEACHRILTG